MRDGGILIEQTKNAYPSLDERGKLPHSYRLRRGARVAEWDGLENRCVGNCTESSNLSLAATPAFLCPACSVLPARFPNPCCFRLYRRAPAAQSQTPAIQC